MDTRDLERRIDDVRREVDYRAERRTVEDLERRVDRLERRIAELETERALRSES